MASLNGLCRGALWRGDSNGGAVVFMHQLKPCPILWRARSSCLKAWFYIVALIECGGAFGLSDGEIVAIHIGPGAVDDVQKVASSLTMTRKCATLCHVIWLMNSWFWNLWRNVGNALDPDHGETCLFLLGCTWKTLECWKLFLCLKTGRVDDSIPWWAINQCLSDVLLLSCLSWAKRINWQVQVSKFWERQPLVHRRGPVIPLWFGIALFMSLRETSFDHSGSSEKCHKFLNLATNSNITRLTRTVCL